jgi:hypothetical protein
MTREELEADLSRKLPVHTVGALIGLHGFPYLTYAELIEAHRKHKVAIKVQYNYQTLKLLGRKSEVVAHHILTWVPFVIMLTPLMLSLLFRNLWLLAAIPASAFGFFLGVVPGFMRVVGNRLFYVMLIVFALGLYNDNVTVYYLAGSYCLVNAFTVLARHQCAWIIRREALKSELIFIALYLDRKILVQPIAAAT